MSGVATNLLDEALGLQRGDPRVSGGGRFVLVEDCVETSGAFVLHHLIKRALLSDPGTVLLVALAHPFSHYDRVLRKLGCNLSAQRDKNNLHFIDLMKLECPANKEGNEVEVTRNFTEDVLVQLFDKLQKAMKISCSAQNNVGHFTILIDDLSLLEIALHGSANHVLDFLHYCATLNSSMDCSIVVLDHMDIYSTTEVPRLLSHLEYLADNIIKAEPLSTGFAADVHGQLTIINKGTSSGYKYARGKTQNFHFKVKENNVDYFYPGAGHS